MDQNVIYNIFLFIFIPLLLTLFFGDIKSKKIFGFLIIGISVCLLASELNSIILSLLGRDFFYYSTTISPIIEEVLKSIPLVFTIFVIYDEPDISDCLSLGLSVGIGFAIFENIVLYFQNGTTESVLWALARGLGAGLMHGICSGAMGFGGCFIKKFGKNHFYGLVGILTTIIIYHGFYNLLVQSEKFKIFGVLLPVITSIIFIPINRIYYKKSQQSDNA